MSAPPKRLLSSALILALALAASPAAAQDAEPPPEPEDTEAAPTAPDPAPPSPEVVKLRNGGAVLTGLGLGVVLGGSAVAAIGQQTAADARAAAEYQDADGRTYLDPAKWAVYEDDFEAGRSLNHGGWVMLAAGSAAAVAGLILLARGATLHHLETVPTAVITPDGAFVGVSGRF